MMKGMRKISVKNKLCIAFILSISIVVAASQATSNISYAQNNSTTPDSPVPSLNKTSADTSANTTATSISIPVSKGYVDGNISYFISTDASEKNIVSSVSNSTKFDVNYAPSLADTPESSRQQGYVFTNGIQGNSPFEFQLPVASAAPDDKGYSPLFEINYAKWNNESNAKVLKSAAEVLEAQNNGELTITKSNIVINSPFVQMK